MARLDRKHAAGRLDRGGAAQPVGDGAGVERRRHGDHAQVFAQRHLRLAHEGERKV
jgi:hypothetical protein